MRFGIDRIKCSIKRVNSISFDDAEAIIHIAFPYFRLYFRRVNGHFFDRFHAQVRHHRADGATHRATMDLFVYFININKVIVR